MGSRIEPDRYADTGYSVKDTGPEINAMIFQTMMRRTPEERFLMGMEMTAAARAMIWSSLTDETEETRRASFLRRFYGDELSEESILTVAGHIFAKSTGPKSPWTVGMTGRFEDEAAFLAGIDTDGHQWQRKQR